MRGQVEVSTLILMGILIASVTTAYTWGKPLLQKSSDRAQVEYVQNKLMEMDSAIREVVRSGAGAQKIVLVNADNALFGIDIGEPYLLKPDGNKTVNANAIDFHIETSVPYVASSEWFWLSVPWYAWIGSLGDPPGVLMVKSVPPKDMLYRLWYRDLMDGQGNLYKTRLAGSELSGVSGNIKVLFENTGSSVQTAATSNITTIVKISLV